LNKRFPKLLSKITFLADGESIEASAAIMSSGTMSLKCCLGEIPGAIVYKTHPITYIIGKTLVKVKYLGIANVLLKRCVWREFIQSHLKPKSVAKYILQCLNNKEIQHSFKTVSTDLRDLLSADKDTSVAQWVVSAIEK
jgi:lipid-A-disaccharide synthase